MAEVRFYHLATGTLERALPRLLEKALARGERAVVVVEPERLEALDAALWTYDDRAFLPHGSARDGHPEHQPVWLAPQVENPNGAGILVLTGAEAAPDLAGWKIAVEFIDGADAAAVAAARERWRRYKDAGHDLSYWTQDENGWTRTA